MFIFIFYKIGDQVQLIEIVCQGIHITGGRGFWAIAQILSIFQWGEGGTQIVPNTNYQKN